MEFVGLMSNEGSVERLLMNSYKVYDKYYVMTFTGFG